jgi:predicted nicotinamide N-methyase
MRLKYRYQNFELGDHTVRLRIPINLEKAIEDEKQVPGISREAFPLFGIVWSSGEVMAFLMLETPVRSKRILEIGCGLGLSSLLLKLRGAEVTAMDIHPLAGELLAGNSVMNECGEIPFVVGSWGDDELDLGDFDLIVGSDILYEPRHASRLADFLDRHLAPNGEIIVVDPDRGQALSFEHSMNEIGFHCDAWRPEFVDHLNIPYAGKIYRFSR